MNKNEIRMKYYEDSKKLRRQKKFLILGLLGVIILIIVPLSIALAVNGTKNFMLNASENCIAEESLQEVTNEANLERTTAVIKELTFSKGVLPNAFHVSMSADSTSGLSIVPFDTVNINIGNSFISAQSRFLAPVDGLYVLYITTGLRASMIADVRLCGTPNTPNILRSVRSNGGETIKMREDMQLLTRNTDIWVSSDNPFSSNNITFPTSFGGFHLNSLMKTVVAFAVRLTKSYSHQGNIPFDYIYYQSSILWKADENVFVAPIGGIYYFSLSVGTSSGLTNISIRANHNPAVQLYSNCNNSCGIETISQSSLLRINKGDEISVYLETGTLCSDIRYQTSFFGFLYQPIITKVAWSLQLSAINLRKKDPLNFDVVLVNEGNGWNTVTHTYEVPDRGHYFIRFCAEANYSETLDVQFLVNGNVIANIKQEAETDNKGVTNISRDVIVHLQESDILRLRLIGDCCMLNGASRKPFSFIGFKLF